MPTVGLQLRRVDQMNDKRRQGSAERSPAIVRIVAMAAMISLAACHDPAGSADESANESANESAERPAALAAEPTRPEERDASAGTMRAATGFEGRRDVDSMPGAAPMTSAQAMSREALVARSQAQSRTARAWEAALAESEQARDLAAATLAAIEGNDPGAIDQAHAAARRAMDKADRAWDDVIDNDDSTWTQLREATLAARAEAREMMARVEGLIGGSQP